jgi:hypothetical protein
MTSPPGTMRAVRLSAPGPVDNLRLTTLPLPPERDGWVRIRVEAFGVNRSELKLRRSRPAGWPFPWTASTTAWSGCRRPTTTWSTTAPAASSSSASGTNTPAETGRPRQLEPEVRP